MMMMDDDDDDDGGGGGDDDDGDDGGGNPGVVIMSMCVDFSIGFNEMINSIDDVMSTMMEHTPNRSNGLMATTAGY